MGNSTDWFLGILRMVAVADNNPVAAFFVQLLSEIDSHRADNRLQKLEEDIQRMKNPISFLNELDEDMENLSKEIYKEMSSKDDDYFRFPDDKFYSKFKAPLEILHKKGLIELQRAYKTSKSPGIEKTSPEYIIYICTFCEDQDKMARLTEIIDNCKEQETLHSGKLKREIGLPELVIKAMFKTYENSGRGEVYGSLSHQYRCL
jgi:hypothetical protein